MVPAGGSRCQRDGLAGAAAAPFAVSADAERDDDESGNTAALPLRVVVTALFSSTISVKSIEGALLAGALFLRLLPLEPRNDPPCNIRQPLRDLRYMPHGPHTHTQAHLCPHTHTQKHIYAA